MPANRLKPILFSLLAVAVALFAFLSKELASRESDIFEDDPEYVFGSRVEGTAWTRACITTQYTWPNLSIPELSGSACLRNHEVPEKHVYIVYLLEHGDCEVSKAKGHFLFKDNVETRCFDREELVGDALKKDGDVIFFVGPSDE